MHICKKNLIQEQIYVKIGEKIGPLSERDKCAVSVIIDTDFVSNKFNLSRLILQQTMFVFIVIYPGNIEYFLDKL